MVGNITLTQIHLRLTEIFTPKDSNQVFGALNLVLFGDLLQVILFFFHINFHCQNY